MAKPLRTLAIDVGGTGLKALLLDPRGRPLTARARVETPRPATSSAVLSALIALVEPLRPFDRASVGFPGVVVDGVIRTAPNLDGKWEGFALAALLAKRLGVPVRALNDAGVQGFGVIEGKGVELVLTFGTGMGTALYVDGRYVPNIELAHHPFHEGHTYEELVSNHAYEKDGKKLWRKRVARVLRTADRLFNPTVIHLGGGNAKHLRPEDIAALGPRGGGDAGDVVRARIKIGDNVAGLLGGIALWDEH